MTTKHTNPNTCAHCGRLLNSYEDVLCGPCARKELAEWKEPSVEERRQAISLRFWLDDWAAIGLAVWVVSCSPGFSLAGRCIRMATQDETRP